MLRGLTADQRGTSLAAARGDAPDELGDADRIEMTDGQVVEEGERLGAGADHVVGAHRDEVDADRVEPADGRGDGRLRADAVGRRDEQRLAIAVRDRERAAEPAQATDDLRPTCRIDVLAHELDRAFAGIDVDAGVASTQTAAGSTRCLSHGRGELVLEDELAAFDVVRHGLRVLAVEAGETEPLVRQVERSEHATDRQIAERVGADEVADLVDRLRGGDELGLDGRVDAVEARVVDRRRADPDVDLAGPGASQQVDDPFRRRAPHDRVVDDDQPLAGDDRGHRVELDGHAAMTHALRRLDECPTGIPVAVHPLAIRQTAAPRRSRRRPGLRCRGPG